MDTKIKVPVTYWLYVLVVSILMFTLWYLWKENAHTMFPSIFYFADSNRWKIFFVILMPFIGIMYGVFFLFAWLQKAKKGKNGLPKDMVSKFMKSKFEVFYSHPEFFLKYNWYAWCLFLLLLSIFAIGDQIFRSSKMEVVDLFIYPLLFVVITVPAALAPVVFFYMFRWLLKVTKINDEPVISESQTMTYYQRLRTVLKYGWYGWSIYLVITFLYTIVSDKYTLNFIKIMAMTTGLPLLIAMPFFIFQFLEWVGKMILKKRNT